MFPPYYLLGPSYGGGSEDNGHLLPQVPCMHCCTPCPQPCSRPPPTHASLETPGHSRASLGQSLVGSLLLSPGAQGSVCALQESISQSCVSSGSSMVGLLVTSSRRAYANPSMLRPEPLSLWQSTAGPYLHRRCSNTVPSQSLWGPWVPVHTRFV